MPETVMPENATVSDASTAAMQTPLDLPAELSYTILDFALISRVNTTGEKIPIRLLSLAHGYRAWIRPIMVNKAFYEAMRPVMFGGNVFQLEQFHELEKHRATSRGHRSGIQIADVRDALANEYKGYPPSWKAKMLSKGTVLETRQYANHTMDFGWRSGHLGMTTPPAKWAELMKNIRFVLTPPPWITTKEEDDCEDYANPDVDWLYPVRHAQEFGFKELDLIQVHVKVLKDVFSRPDLLDRWPDQKAVELDFFMRWTQETIDGIEPKPAGKIVVSFAIE